MGEERIISNHTNTIGRNLRKIRKSKNIRMKDMIIMLQLHSVEISRETLVKIEGGRQHIKLSQLRGLKELLDVSYEIILEEEKM